MKTAKYKLLGEVSLYDYDDYYPSEEEMSSICIVKCRECGWRMFGDSWKPTPYGHIGEQIPAYCAHCGAKFEWGESE